MADITEQKRRARVTWARVAVFAGLVVAAPLAYAGVRLAWQAASLPPRLGTQTPALMWRSALLALGMAIGTTGSIVALAYSSTRARTMGPSAALLGASCAAMGFVIAWYVTGLIEASGPSPVPVVILSALIVLSLAAFFGALREEKTPTEPEQEAGLTEEQPQPLSRP